MAPNFSDRSLLAPHGEGFDQIPRRPERAYLLQAHPAIYNLRTKLATRKRGTWRLPVLLEEMRKGDVVILWQGGPRAGIYGIALAATDPVVTSRQPAFRKHSRISSCGLKSVVLHYIYALAAPLLQTELESHKSFAAETVIRRGVTRAGNIIEEQEWKAIYKLLQANRRTKYDTSPLISDNAPLLPPFLFDSAPKNPEGDNYISASLLPTSLQRGSDYAPTGRFEWSSMRNAFNLPVEVTTEQLVQRLLENPNAAESSDIYRMVRVRGAAQQLFARLMRRVYEDRCAFCGFSLWPALEAAHIKPWSLCKPGERLLPSNGLLLCAVHHRLFDVGILTLTDQHLVNVIALESLQYITSADDHYVLDLHGTSAHLPVHPDHRPAKEFLKFRRELVLQKF